MGNTIQFPLEKVTDSESLFLASSILLEMNRIVRGIHVIAEVLLRYAAVGTSITDNLIEMVTFNPSEEA